MIDFTELLQSVKTMEQAAAGFTPVNIRILRNYTIEGIEPFLKYHLYPQHLNPNIPLGGYNTAQQEVLAVLEPMGNTREVIVLTLLLDQLDSDSNLPSWDSKSVRDYLQGLLVSLAAQTTAMVVLNTFLLPSYDEMGIVGARHSLTHTVQDFNRLLEEFVEQHSSQFIIIDWNRIMRRIGEAEALDVRNSMMFSAPFRPAFLYEYAKEIAIIIRALTGKTKKCLVLDCDNTLWGGIVGEEGSEGIQLDRNRYPGKVFYEFQKTVLHLLKRGVMIALCSKNNPEDVWAVLDHHPYCLIHKDHLSAWQINWDDKAKNIKRLAQQLNIGLDSFVFVDDNPSECELIRQLCSEVTILQVPAKLSLYPDLLLKDGLFDVLSVSDEDGRRTQLYRDEQERQVVKSTYQTLDEYLISLQTEVIVQQATSHQVARVAQLTQKTNQFNLTTRRYSENEITQFMEDQDNIFVATVMVKDCFGDLGLTGVFIAKRQARVMVIDTFLLSCRVLGRNVEQAFLQQCIAKVEQTMTFDTWEASYIPTAKNSQVAAFWTQAGFVVQADKHYYLARGQYFPLALPHIKIVREESENETSTRS